MIGAGPSGVTSIKALTEAGLDVTAFEASDRIGGNWAIHNPNGTSAAYETLYMNTSRERMQFSDFPINPTYPDFPRHDQVARYFEDYADRFGLRDRICFNTVVERVEPLPGGGFEVSTAPREGTAGGESPAGAAPGSATGRFDAVVVANGHHWLPRWPDPMPPGAEEFTGELMHAHAYRDPAQLDGLRVVVVGLGNSATDIAVDASYRADDPLRTAAA